MYEFICFNMGLCKVTLFGMSTENPVYQMMFAVPKWETMKLVILVRELYPGSDCTLLKFIIEAFNMKVTTGWTNKALDMFLKFQTKILPTGQKEIVRIEAEHNSQDGAVPMTQEELSIKKKVHEQDEIIQEQGEKIQMQDATIVKLVEAKEQQGRTLASVLEFLKNQGAKKFCRDNAFLFTKHGFKVSPEELCYFVIDGACLFGLQSMVSKATQKSFVILLLMSPGSAVMFAPMVNPYESSMTKEEMSGTWEMWVRRRTSQS
ncbi:hypothetical protein Vadar_001941 [Vaccinium darrowii]|uniref:Uncharacterized protein n=1 Tax=Vaccinium darrowii TaxID=229202 RepID=A0ACB7XMF5_9ERIC|nr:hypothetical protein Vadar_001941 [Vaccinium darrowii]